MVRTTRIRVETHAPGDLHDLTPQVQEAVTASGYRAGIATVFVAHTTAAVAISEVEPGLRVDLPAMFERLVPADLPYRHNALNYDDNAHSHLRTSLLGPSLTVPFDEGRLLLGTWQRIVLLEFDTHPRSRQVVIQVLGA
ncbi:MAG: secondary thiamine-phosphate synthase enzyme YjbQ [Sphaerobacter sp.]|nr:secondary thiamine-phosphate synthase enzyme YjbQ [Sphaerobacter sp.]